MTPTEPVTPEDDILGEQMGRIQDDQPDPTEHAGGEPDGKKED